MCLLWMLPISYCHFVICSVGELSRWCVQNGGNPLRWWFPWSKSRQPVVAFPYTLDLPHGHHPPFDHHDDPAVHRDQDWAHSRLATCRSDLRHQWNWRELGMCINIGCVYVWVYGWSVVGPDGARTLGFVVDIHVYFMSFLTDDNYVPEACSLTFLTACSGIGCWIQKFLITID